MKFYMTKSFIVFLLWFMLINIPSLSQTANNLILFFCEIVISAWIFSKKAGENLLKICIPIFLLWASFVLTTMMNVGVHTRTANAIVKGYQYVLYFYVLAYFIRQNDFQHMMDEIFILTVVALLISDAVVVISGGRGIGGNDVLGNYFIGNKFTVSYTHMLLLALFSQKLLKKKRAELWPYLLLALYSICICILMECSTGVIGCAVMLLYTILDWKKTGLSNILEHPVALLAVMFGVTVLLVEADFLLSIPRIAALLLKYSHTSKPLSGRIEMYEIAFAYAKKRPLVGYGINCTIVEDILTWGNAQNGLLKIFLDHGMIGIFLFVVVCYASLKKAIRSDTVNVHAVIAPFISLLYGLAICSSVEICLRGEFYLALAIVNAFTKLRGSSGVFYENKGMVEAG